MRCSRRDEIARFERHDCADVRDELTHREDHVARVAALSQRFVNPTTNAARCGIDVRDDHGACWTERVETFRTCPLTIFLLQIARRDIIDARVPKDVLEGMVDGDVATSGSDHDTKFRFVVDVRAGAWQFDDVVRSDDRRGRLEEEQRFGRHVVAKFSRVRAIVSPDAHDLRGRDGSEIFRCRPGNVFVRIAWVFPRSC